MFVKKKEQGTTISSTTTTPISILLLGDSLTEGYTQSGQVYHSYGIQLKKRFEEAGKDVEIIIEGMSGDRVAGKIFENRLKKAIKKQTNEGKKFDYVVILGGTNDCFQELRANASKIFDGLKNLYSICENHGAFVLALTVIEFVYSEGLDFVEVRRNELNELIRNYSTNNSKIILYDLAKEHPANSITKKERKLYWENDGVHLTIDGYDHMGDLIYEALYNQITKEQNKTL